MTLRIQLVDSLKRLLKAQGITYAMLATQINMSEATVKRMFSRQSIRLERLEQICDVLGVGLAELAGESQNRPSPLTQLSVSSERILVNDPALMLAMFLCINRWTQEEVLEHYNFDVPGWTHKLTLLDKMGVIELLPNNRYRVRTARNFRWRRNGPFEGFVLEKLLPDYFSRGFAKEGETVLLLNGMVSERTARNITLRLEEAAEGFDAMLALDATLPVANRVGVSLVLAQRPWNFKVFDPLRKVQVTD